MQTILIADDSSTARMIIRRCLEIAGCSESRFLEASNGEEALAIVQKENIDLLVTDLNMPVMDGRQLLHSIKSSPLFNTLPVLVVTSLGNPAIEIDLLAQGADKVVPKPISPAQMQQILANLFQKGFRQILEPPATPIEIICRAASQTFEEVAFEEVVFVDSARECPPEMQDVPPSYWARLKIHTPPLGEVMIWVPADFIARIVSSIHCQPPEELPESLLSDTLAELLNTLCGRLMAQRVSANQVFNLDLPQSGKGRLPTPAAPASFVRFSVGEEKIVLVIPDTYSSEFQGSPA